MACRKRYVGELGRPHWLLAAWSRDVVDMTGTGIRSSRVRRGVEMEILGRPSWMRMAELAEQVGIRTVKGEVTDGPWGVLSSIIL